MGIPVWWVGGGGVPNRPPSGISAPPTRGIPTHHTSTPTPALWYIRSQPLVYPPHPWYITHILWYTLLHLGPCIPTHPRKDAYPLSGSNHPQNEPRTRNAPPSRLNRMIDNCENITFPQLRWRAVTNCEAYLVL